MNAGGRRGSGRRRAKALLLQLPVPQTAAHAPTGNVALAAGQLAVATTALGLGDAAEVAVVPPHVTDRLGDELLADEVAAASPDVVGLSLYLWNAERSLHLARLLKDRWPSTRVVVCGINLDSADAISSPLVTAWQKAATCGCPSRNSRASSACRPGG